MANDLGLAKKVWEKSEIFVNLKPEERHYWQMLCKNQHKSYFEKDEHFILMERIGISGFVLRNAVSPAFETTTNRKIYIDNFSKKPCLWLFNQKVI